MGRRRTRTEPRCYTRIDDEQLAVDVFADFVKRIAACCRVEQEQIIFGMSLQLEGSSDPSTNPTALFSRLVFNLDRDGYTAWFRRRFTEAGGMPPILAPLLLHYVTWASTVLLDHGSCDRSLMPTDAEWQQILAEVRDTEHQ